MMRGAWRAGALAAPQRQALVEIGQAASGTTVAARKRALPSRSPRPMTTLFERLAPPRGAARFCAASTKEFSDEADILS
jgi:hypothetical protein